MKTQKNYSPVAKSPIKSRGNGTKEAISRYTNLKIKLDSDLTNNNWYIEDTSEAKISNGTYNFIDLFAGAGGLSVGFRNAGFSKVASIEIDEDASDTIKKNFPESTHFCGKIEDVTEADLKKAIGDKTIHVVCGGPPCQGFSVAGLRNPHDPRNKLFQEFVRVVKYVKPWYVLLENVPGILTMEDGKVYREIIRQFEEIGYPNMSIRILEAATLGVPQLRTRAIFIANRFGLKNPYPREIYDRNNYKPIESAIDDLKRAKRNPTNNHEWTDHSKAFEKRISKVPPGGSLYETFRDAFKRQYRGVPSMTIKENHGGCHIHYELNRVLSAREMARLQTFPDNFIFSGTMKRAYWQIGNAVPCLMAQHIATALRLNLKKCSPEITS